MSVRFLVIEDDPSFLEVLQRMLAELGSDVSLQFAMSRDSALSALEAESFDIILLDLKLPTADGTLDEDAEHGRLVFHAARRLAPGSPIIVLTGSPTETFIRDFLSQSEQVDVWGDERKIPTVEVLRKSELDDLPKLLEPCAASVRAVRDVEIRSAANLTWEEDRLVRIFVRRRGGVSCTVHTIGGGLSGASVLRVAVFDTGGAPLLHGIMKIAPHDDIAAECANYDRYAQRLLEQATPRLFEHIKYGGGKQSAVCYRLAQGFDADLFQVAAQRPDIIDDVIGRACTLLAPWRDGVGETRRTVGEIRARLVSDEKAVDIVAAFDLPWVGAFEQRSVQARWCPIHGDLHGGNVLVNDDGIPIIIDYGDVGTGPSALDWIGLELSTIFHIEGCARHSGWPDERACQNWPNAEAFAVDSPVAAFIIACRTAAEVAGVGPRELAACAYAYLFRQLGYEDTDKEIALRLIERIRQFIETET